MRRRVQLLTMLILLVGFVGLATSQAQDSAPQNPKVAPYEVHAGTRFLVALHDKLSTKEDKRGKQFTARTLEEIVSADGTTLPAGAEVRGHIDKVVSAGKTGRAKIWLPFCENHHQKRWVALLDEMIGTS